MTDRIWFTDATGYSVRYERRNGKVYHTGEDDDIPEDFLPLDAGWAVFDGAERNPTPEECESYGRGLDVNDIWWDGAMREATAAEVLEFFALALPPAPTPREGEGQTCARCNGTGWVGHPATGHECDTCGQTGRVQP